MARRGRTNPLDRRSEKLAREMQRREGAVFTKLTDPAPAFMVKKSELNALRDYLRVRANPDGLMQLRGVYGDDSVDQYVAWGENALAKYLPDLMARGSFPADTDPEMTENPSFEEQDDDAMTTPFGPVSAEGF